MKHIPSIRAFLLTGMAATVFTTLLAFAPGKINQAWGATVDSPLSPLAVTEVAGCWSIRDDKSIAVSTTQVGVGWWNKNDELTIATQKEHVAIIPKGAVMISIPSNCQGQPVPEDWMKSTRADGEWVIIRK